MRGSPFKSKGTKAHHCFENLLKMIRMRLFTMSWLKSTRTFSGFAWWTGSRLFSQEPLTLAVAKWSPKKRSSVFHLLWSHLFEATVENGDNCQQEQKMGFYCYCPMDFRGSTCESWDPVECDVKPVKENCFLESEAFHYDPKYFDKLAPCKNITEESGSSFSLELNCSNSEEGYYFEGFKSLDWRSSYSFNSKDHVTALSLVDDYYEAIGYNWRANNFKTTTASDYFLDSGRGLVDIQMEIPGNNSNSTLYGPFEYFYQNENVSVTHEVAFWLKGTSLNWNNLSASIEKEFEIPINSISSKKLD